MRHQNLSFGTRHYEKPSTSYGDLEHIFLGGAYVAFPVILYDANASHLEGLHVGHWLMAIVLLQPTHILMPVSLCTASA